MADTLAKRPVVLFSARYLPSVGGVEFFTANLAHQLATMGYTVVVVTTERADDGAADVRTPVGEGSIEVMRLHSWGPQRIPILHRDAHFGACRKRLAKLAPFHALINTRFYDLSTVAAHLCKKMGVRPVLIDHGTGYITFPNPLLSAISKNAEHFITNNLRRFPVDYYGVSRDASAWLRTFGITSCGEIHNALDSDAFAAQASGRSFRAEFGVAPDCLCVSFAGRLLPEKGADTIVAAARLLRDDPRFHFFVAGRGAMEQEVNAAADELDNLSYVGVLSHPDLASLLLEGDVFCFPTRYSEGLPTSLLEAAACENALVASHAGGVDEIIAASDQGIILDDPGAPAVVQALKALADDPERLALLKRAAHDHVCACFSWESTAREVLTAFDRASC